MNYHEMLFYRVITCKKVIRTLAEHLLTRILAAALALKIEFKTHFKCTYYPHVEQWLRRSSRDHQS